MTKREMKNVIVEELLEKIKKEGHITHAELEEKALLLYKAELEEWGRDSNEVTSSLPNSVLREGIYKRTRHLDWVLSQYVDTGKVIL